MTDRLLTALGALAAAAAVVAAFALLFSVLGSNGSGTPTATVLRVSVPGGTTAAGRLARPGHASVGVGAPRQRAAAARGAAGPTARTDAGGGSRPPRVPILPGRPRRGTAFAIAHVLKGARVALRRAPGGPVLARVAAETAFGSPASFSVVATRPGWLGVTAPELRDGAVGWIHRDPRRVQVYWTRWSLRANLAARRLQLRYGHRVVRSFPVTVGGPGTETPPGRYGVTDGVSFHDSPYYGCCALALSGHQTRLPAGWIGGNRLAIHGTPGAVGNAESLGCIRATDETMRFLFARIPLGTPVIIAA